MSEEKYMQIFAANLNRLLQEHGKTQVDIVNDLGFATSTVSSWCVGKRLPRMEKVDMLARYFGVNRSDLIEEQGIRNNGQPEHYIDKETAAVMQKMAESPDHHALFDMLSNTTPEEARKYVDLIKVLTGQNDNN